MEPQQLRTVDAREVERLAAFSDDLDAMRADLARVEAAVRIVAKQPRQPPPGGEPLRFASLDLIAEVLRRPEREPFPSAA